MTQFNYNPVITGRVIKTKKELFDNFFYQGHPLFLIPDFDSNPCDIWLSYLDFLEKNHSCEVYDQDGGEITSYDIIDPNTGLIKCIYTAYGIQLDESEDPQDVEVEIEGYVEEIPQGSFSEYIFVANKVFEQYKFVI